METLISPYVQVQFYSPETNGTTVKTACRFCLETQRLSIESRDGIFNFNAGFQSRDFTVAQLTHTLHMLSRSNLNPSSSEYENRFFEDLDIPAFISIEPFPDEEDPFTATFTFHEEESKKKVWLAISETELKKVISAVTRDHFTLA